MEGTTSFPAMINQMIKALFLKIIGINQIFRIKNSGFNSKHWGFGIEKQKI